MVTKTNEPDLFMRTTRGEIISFSIDGRHRISNLPVREILQYAGLIPAWIQDKPLEMSMRACCKEQYHYGWHPFADGKGTIDEDRVYSYPEDPDLVPYGVFETEEEMLICYDYAIFAFIDKTTDNTLIVRMD